MKVSGAHFLMKKVMVVLWGFGEASLGKEGEEVGGFLVEPDKGAGGFFASLFGGS